MLSGWLLQQAGHVSPVCSHLTEALCAARLGRCECVSLKAWCWGRQQEEPFFSPGPAPLQSLPLKPWLPQGFLGPSTVALPFSLPLSYRNEMGVGMVRLVMCLLRECVNPSLHPQHPHKKLGGHTHTCNPSTEEEEKGGLRRPAGQYA